MSGFDDREKGFEAKYRVDQELEFKINARRNRLLGAWAAELMGVTGEAAESYAKAVAGSRPRHRSAAAALVEELAGIHRHLQLFSKTAIGAGEFR